MPTVKLSRFLAIIAPGILVAATGVGSGDLATGSFAGSLLGTAILWAVVVGAFLKFVVTEGIARWQLATNSTILEGVAFHLGPVAIYIFLPFLLLWSFFVGAAMMGGCGVTLHAIFPVFDDPRLGKIFFGIASSIIGLILIYSGGYKLFEKIMSLCIGIMFFTVVLTAIFLWPGTGEILSGLLIPTIPDFNGKGLTWTIALIGGVGGTVTVLSYGYWIREEGRLKEEDLSVCRIDLSTCYLMTAIFGISVVIIGSNIEIEGSGATLLVNLSDQLSGPLGPLGKWLFLIGATATVFSSLLGVWQATPYIFADVWTLFRDPTDRLAVYRPRVVVDTKAPAYRVYLILLAFIPMIGLFVNFQQAQKLYAVTGAFFIPMLALALLLLNGRSQWIGSKLRNRYISTISLIATLIFFLWVAVTKLLT